MVARRGDEAGDHQLPDLQAGARRSVLRQDLRPRQRLGVLVRQIQAHEASRCDLRQVWRRGHAVEGSARAHGPHRARLPGVARVVFQGLAIAHGAPARHDHAGDGADPVLRGLCRCRCRPGGSEGGRAHQRGALPRSARRVRRFLPRHDGRGGDQGAATAHRRRAAGDRASCRHEGRDVETEARQVRQAPQGR